jgi:PAS domain S-box-containing protein
VVLNDKNTIGSKKSWAVGEPIEEALTNLDLDQSRLAAIFLQAPAFIATLRGPAHVFEMANPKYEQLIGNRDILGKSVREALPELEGQGFYELLDEVYRTGKRFIGDELPALLQRTANGPLELRYVNFVYQPFFEVEGSVSGIFVHGVDVTDMVKARLRAEELAEINRTITDNAASCLFLIDETGRPTFMNPAAEAVTGYTLDEIKDRPIHDSIHHTRPDGTPYPRSECPFSPERPGRVREARDVFIRKDGTFFPVSCSVAPLERNGAVVGAVMEFRDITEQERVEVALREADRRKDEFLAMLGHELRNPLAPIRNAVYLLRQPGTPEPFQERARNMIDRQVTHMARLVDDLLDVSRISRGKILLHKERLDLASLVRDAVEDHRGSLEALGLTVELALPPGPLFVEGDATRLSQALGNLLHNAGKFSDPEGRVTVTVSAPAGRSTAEITVADTGIGIEPEMMERLWEIFSQADRSLDRSRGGLGLGLSLVKGLVDLHGGEVEAASEGLGHGARFTVRLPLAETGPR